MMNKEAIECLKNMIDRENVSFACTAGTGGDTTILEYRIEALQMAIKALKDMSKDLIQREEALQMIDTIAKAGTVVDDEEGTEHEVIYRSAVRKVLGLCPAVSRRRTHESMESIRQ